ncbi:hypothetical protein [Inediibacterium massiliense]|uniref:hypothetical protein n=1 Tax=Inediibacterium massiliense TaxID=1658111 RepID=UPI0006B4AEAC|nr:hypothetical protein [Inediibacterium massiliense]
MWEKCKDVLYETSDLLLALVIILFMSTVITWKVTDSLAYSNEENVEKESIKTEQSADVDVSPKKTTEKTPEKISTLHINIPNGTFGMGIAQILKENGLIDDPQEFINQVTKLGMDSKLKSGEFDIPSNSSLDDIIYIITGSKK